MKERLVALALLCWTGILAYKAGGDAYLVLAGFAMGAAFVQILLQRSCLNLIDSANGVIESQTRLIDALKRQSLNLQKENELLKDRESWKLN